MKRISEFFTVVAVPKQPAIEETSSDLPINAKPSQVTRLTSWMLSKGILHLASKRLGMTNIGKRHSLG